MTSPGPGACNPDCRLQEHSIVLLERHWTRRLLV
jgi:hypothetical protein